MNPRIGVLLRLYGASPALLGALLPRCRLISLRRFLKDWPHARRRAELPGWSDAVAEEWERLLCRRAERRGS